MTYVNDPSACPGAEPHDPEGSTSIGLPRRLSRAQEEAIPDSRRNSSSPVQRLEWALPDESNDVYPNWEIVNEPPEDPKQRRPDLVEWGVIATARPAITRAIQTVIRRSVPSNCGHSKTRRAHASRSRILSFRIGEIDRQGDTLVMLRAVTLRGGLGQAHDFSRLREAGRGRANAGRQVCRRNDAAITDAVLDRRHH